MRFEAARSISGSPISNGLSRALRGLRTGDQRSLYAGVALIVFGLWRRGRAKETRKLIYRKTLRPGEALLIRPSSSGADKLIVSEEFAAEAKRKPRKPRT